MEDEIMVEDNEYLRLDELPYVCLWHISSFLPPESLAQLSGVNQIFRDVCSSEQLWRDHCLYRWQFCNISQVSEGPQRWQRYFRARRKVEARMDTGRPTKDYRVKSLRGHSVDIIDVICVNDCTDDLQNPTPPLIISLSSDHVVYAWDVKEGKPVWSLENIPATCITGDNDTVIVGDSIGHVTLYRTSDWSEVNKFPSSNPDRSVASLKVVSTTLNKKKYHILMVCYMVQDSSGEILLIDLSQNKPLVTLTTNIGCNMVEIKGSWLAAAQEVSASEVYIWNLNDVMFEQTTPSLSPHVTLHLTNHCSRPLIWIKPGVIATCSTSQHSTLFPHPVPLPQPPLPPGQVHIMQPRRLPGPVPMAMPLPFQQSSPSSDLETWDVAKHMVDAKKATSYVFNVKHMYDCLSSIKMSCLPQSIAYSNGKIVAGESNGCVKVIDISNGQCLQTFNDHKGSVTDIYADSYRLLTCSKDFSIRVYRWIKESGAAKSSSYKLDSRYQLLGGSVALKTHDGFNRVLGQSGSCVGVAGNILKLYTFIHQLE